MTASGGMRTKLAGGTCMTGKINFKFGIYLYLCRIKFKNLRIFLTVYHLKRNETQIVNWLTVSCLCTFLFYVDLAYPDYLGLRLLYIIDLLFVTHLRNSILAWTSCFPGI